MTRISCHQQSSPIKIPQNHHHSLLEPGRCIAKQFL